MAFPLSHKRYTWSWMNERVDQKNIYMLLSALKELKRLDIFMKSQVCSRAEDIHDIREMKRAKLTRIIWRGILIVTGTSLWRNVFIVTGKVAL